MNIPLFLQEPVIIIIHHHLNNNRITVRPLKEILINKIQDIKGEVGVAFLIPVKRHVISRGRVGKHRYTVVTRCMFVLYQYVSVGAGSRVDRGTAYVFVLKTRSTCHKQL